MIRGVKVVSGGRESGAASEGINWDYFNWVGRPVNYRLR